MLNAALIDSEEELGELLTGLGFANHPASLHLRATTFDGPTIPEREAVVCRTVDATANQLPVIVSIEAGSFCVSFYEDVNYIFRLWDHPGEDVSETVLRDVILKASSIEASKRD